MSCHCKRNLEFEKKYGIEEKETPFQRVMRNVMKVGLFTFLVSSIIVIMPFLLVVVFYKLIFSKNKVINLPKLFGKNMNYKSDGEKL